MTTITIFSQKKIDEKTVTVPVTIGTCKICEKSIKADVPADVPIMVNDPPLFCEACRKGILKVARPELEENKK